MEKISSLEVVNYQIVGFSTNARFFRDHLTSTYAKFPKFKCAYQRVRNVSFSENFEYALDECSLIISLIILTIDVISLSIGKRLKISQTF